MNPVLGFGILGWFLGGKKALNPHRAFPSFIWQVRLNILNKIYGVQFAMKHYFPVMSPF